MRAASRRIEFLEGRGWHDAELVQADVLAPETLRPVLKDIDVVYYMVHGRGGGRGFAAREQAAANNLREAMAAAGIARCIVLRPLANSHAGTTRDQADSGSPLKSGPVPLTEVQTSVVIGPGSACFEVARDLVRHLPVMVTPKWTRLPVRPIALDDLLTFLAGLTSVLGEEAGSVHRLIGPEPVTFQTLLREFAAIEGKHPRIIAAPVVAPGLSALWLDLATSLPLHMGRPLIDGFIGGIESGCTGPMVQQTVTSRTPAQAIRLALDTEHQAGLAARWAEGAVTYRGYNPEPDFYRLSFSTLVEVAAPAAFTWKTVSRIGGDVGYYYGDSLWRLRGVIDRLVGGVGMRRGRRDPELLRAGDALDFWRVAVAEPPRQLTLVAEMKVPGDALLEFSVLDDGPDRSRVQIDARFRPSGLAGLLYWYSLLVVHRFIFEHMPRNLARIAERSWRDEQAARATQQRAANS